MSVLSFILWGFVLIAQNFAFTFVSRARNSGSLKKHMVAGFFSNAVWFVGQLFAVNAFMGILAGHYGVLAAIGAGLYYTAFTLTGSLLAHYYALKTEKGNSRVGAHKDVGTFTKAEADALRNEAILCGPERELTPNRLLALLEMADERMAAEKAQADETLAAWLTEHESVFSDDEHQFVPQQPLDSVESSSQPDGYAEPC